MRRTAKILVSIATTYFVAALPFATSAQQKVCTESEAKRAEEESDQLKDWDSAYQFFRRFRHCDDGAIADGYSESVAKLLAKDWKHLGDFDRLISKDRDFKTFVFRHIDETADGNDLKAIVENATLRCPSGKRRLCRSLELKAKDSLRNLAM